MWSLISVLILLFVYSLSPVQSEALWTYDLISIEVDNHTPEVAVLDLHETRVSRGVFAFSGTIDIKQDITDDFIAGMTTYYSLSGQNYVKAAFFIKDCKLSDCLKDYYPLIMDDLEKCSENLPKYDENFKPPLKPTTIKFNNCLLTNDKLPEKIRNGYYKIILEFKTLIKSSITYTIQVFDK